MSYQIDSDSDMNDYSNKSYNQSGNYTFYTIKPNLNDEVAIVKKIGLLNGYEMEEIIQQFIYKEYQKDYMIASIEVKEFFTNPIYIQERVSVYIASLLLDGFIGNMDIAISEYTEGLKKKIQNKILFLHTPYKPKSFDFIVSKYNLPELLEKDSYELFDSWYDGIDFIITYDPIIQT
jgi:hypothetical protein